MKKVSMESDYSTAKLNILQSDDGDIIIDIYGDGEFRIATDGGRLHGNKLVQITKKFSEIIDLLNNE